MKRLQFIFPAMAIAGALVGCSLGGTSAPTSAAPVATRAPEDTPAVSELPQATVVQTAINPCDLVPQDEASALANFNFGEGQLEANPGKASRCTYGSETTNVMIIEVAQASDVATAQQDRDQFIAFLQSQAASLAEQGLVITQIPDFADGAVSATLDASIGGVTISGSALGFLHDTVFFGISDLTRGQPAPTIDALKNEANTVIARLP